MMPMDKEPPLILDDTFYDSAIPELIDINLRAQRQASLMFAKGLADAPDHLDLELNPMFMRNPDGSLVDKDRSIDLAYHILQGLHEEWRGTEPLEHKVSDSFTERYWEFVDNEFFPWTVIELSDTHAAPSSVGLTAYMIRGRRPPAFQALINKQEADLHPQIQEAVSEGPVEKEPRRKHIASKLAGLVRKAREKPGGPRNFRHY